MQISPYVIPGLKFHYGLPVPNDKLVFIENIVTKFYGQTVEGIKQRGRKREKVLCRQICFYLMRRHTHLTCKAIGDRFNGQDHTTVIHGVNALNNLMETDPKLRADVQLLEAKIDERK